MGLGMNVIPLEVTQRLYFSTVNNANIVGCKYLSKELQ
jgi:hypothetical protein